jgi:hypothetical protein
MRIHGFFAPVALCAGFALSMPALAMDIALGGRAATMGFGGDMTMGVTPWLNIRASANAFNYTYSDTYGDVSYDAELNLQSAGVLLDFHPFRGNFRLSAGTYVNGNGIDFTGRPTQNVTIGGQSFTPAEVGTLAGTVEFRKYAPYLGLGWGNAVGAHNRLGFNVEIGVLFQGAPDVEMRSEGGTFSNNPLLVSEIENEERSVERDLGNFEFYPVVGLGMSYAF